MLTDLSNRQSYTSSDAFNYAIVFEEWCNCAPTPPIANICLNGNCRVATIRKKFKESKILNIFHRILSD